MKMETLDSVKIETGEKIPVFPLPNTVFFPHVELPIYIFEPKYRKMLRECLKGKNMIAISLLKKGWESAPEPYPSYDTVGVGFVKLSVLNSDGTSNIVLKGFTRAKILEYVQWEPFRIAKLTPIKSLDSKGDDTGWRVRKLLKLMLEKIFHTQHAKDQDLQSIEKIKDPEELSDLAAFTLNTDSYIKQEILETLDIQTRLDRLIKLLEHEVVEIKRRKS